MLLRAGYSVCSKQQVTFFPGSPQLNPAEMPVNAQAGISAQEISFYRGAQAAFRRNPILSESFRGPWLFPSLLPTQNKAGLQKPPLCAHTEGQHLQTEISCCTPQRDQELPVPQTPI